MLLKVLKVDRQDVYTDIIRVFEDNRIDESTKVKIPSGSICRVEILEKKNSVYAILRGTDYNNESIYIDESLREALSVEYSHEYNFVFRKAGFFGSLLWMWRTTDTGYRVASRIAIISLGISLMSVLIPVTTGFMSIFKYFINQVCPS